MATFIVRVELHQAHESDYLKLHGEMVKRGFEQTITSDNGIIYHLPPAEYYFNVNATGPDVRLTASAAAAEVGRGYSILVSEFVNAYWENLTPVRPLYANSTVQSGLASMLLNLGVLNK